MVNEYNNTYLCSSGRKPVYADYSDLTGETESGHKAPKFKVGEIVNVTNYKHIVSRGCNKNLSKRLFVTYVFIINPWPYKIKGLNGDTIIGSLYGKQFLLSIL